MSIFWGKPKPQKISYYKPVKSMIPFGGWKWKWCYGSEGAMPLLTEQTVSCDSPVSCKPTAAPKLTKEEKKAQKAEEERQQIRAKIAAEEKAKAEVKAKADAKAKAKAEGKPIPKEPPPKGEEVEEKLPVFVLTDIVQGMRSLGWMKSATLIQRWFDGKALTIPKDDKQLGRPIDSETITLEWALGFKRVKSKYNELLEKISNDKAMGVLKPKVERQIKKSFAENPHNPSFSTAPFLADLQKFHLDWQFQRNDIDNFDGRGSGIQLLTDFTGSLGRCAIYAAIGYVSVSGPQYYVYDNTKNTKSYCREPTIRVTHIYVYIRDVFEFNEWQYLGHWNKTGMILAPDGTFGFLGHAPFVGPSGSKPLPVDTRPVGRKLLEENVYWSVHNSDFQKWREKYGKGGDFVVFSKPVLLKLRDPITFTMENLCTPPEKM
jgi:hypothetical protein